MAIDSKKIADKHDRLTVFTESREALEAAYRGGLSGSATIVTSSPALLLDPEITCTELDARLSGARLRAFIDQVNLCTQRLHLRTQSDPDLAGFSATITRVFNGFQNALRKAAYLTGEDFTAHRMVLQCDSGNELTNRILNPPWGEFLKPGVHTEVQDYAIALPSFGATFGGGMAGPLTRARVVGLRRVLLRTLTWLWRILPGRWGRGDIFILKDNELIKDTALALAARGYRVVRIPLPKSVLRDVLPNDLGVKIRSCVELEMDRAFGKKIFSSAFEFLKTRICETACNQVADQIAARRYWDQWLRRLPRKRKRVILSNAPNGPVIAGLVDVCSGHGAPLVAFQHGIRREIADTPIDLQIDHEDVVADLLIAFSKQGVNVSEQSPYRRCEAAAVGLPGDYYRTRSSSSRRRAPILYVSTTLYLGNVQRLTATASDADRARREVALIDKVFAGAPQRVAYKPYPALRYPDPDPIVVAARDCPNIDLYEKEIDLRYMIGGHRLVITSGATSTVGWCALSGLPLVMIDWPDTQPLQAEMREKFAEAFFLFDGSEPDFMDRLADFLAQPLEAIEREAATKESSRKALLHEVFGAWGPGAGGRAADIIVERFFSGERTASGTDHLAQTASR